MRRFGERRHLGRSLVAAVACLGLWACLDFTSAEQSYCDRTHAADCPGSGGDAGSTDAGGAVEDAGSTDAGPTDAGSGDAGSSDAGFVDAGSSDAGAGDAGTADAGTLDAGIPFDGGVPVCVVTPAFTGWATISLGFTPPGDLDTVTGTGPDDLWAFGELPDGGAWGVHWDSALNFQQVTLPAGTAGLMASAAVAPGEVWAAGLNGSIRHYTDGGWLNPVNPDAGAKTAIWDLQLTSPGRLIAISEFGRIQVIDRDAGVVSRDFYGTNADLSSGWTDGRTGWVGGAGVIMSSTSVEHTWTVERSDVLADGGYTNWYAAAGPEWFLGGDSQSPRRLVMVRHVGSQASLRFSPVGTCVGDAGVLDRVNMAFALSPRDLWAVGDNGVILHGDGVSWTASSNTGGTQPTFNDLYDVWASSPTDVWAVGRGGVVLHKSF